MTGGALYASVCVWTSIRAIPGTHPFGRGSLLRPQGISGTTIADIEREAGYSPRAGGVYRHYPTKKAMLEAVIDAAIAGNESMIEEMRRSARTSDDPTAGARRRSEPTQVAVPMTPPQLAELIVRRALAELDRQPSCSRSCSVISTSS